MSSATHSGEPKGEDTRPPEDLDEAYKRGWTAGWESATGKAESALAQALEALREVDERLTRRPLLSSFMAQEEEARAALEAARSALGSVTTEERA